MSRFDIMDDGIRLNAKLDMPENPPEKLPLVIVIHGFTGHMEERHITAVCKTLNEIGLATLRVDMYGHGSSEGRFEDRLCKESRLCHGSAPVRTLPGRDDRHAGRRHEA